MIRAFNLLLFVALCGIVVLPGCRDSEESEVCVDRTIPLIGEVPDECFALTSPEDSFYVFRGERTWSFDLDQDGEQDVELIIDDGSFGIAGPTRAKIELVPLQEEYSIANALTRSEYCTRWWSAPGEPFYGPIDSRLCMWYTEEELMEYDTFSVDVYEDFMAISHEAGEEIDMDVDWATDRLLVAHVPWQPGDLRYNESNYFVFRREREDEIKYGWLDLHLTFSYGVYGVVREYGFMK